MDSEPIVVGLGGRHTSSNTSPKTRSAFGLCPDCSGAVPVPVPVCSQVVLLPPNMPANMLKKLLDAFGSLVRSEDDLLADSLSYSRRR